MSSRRCQAVLVRCRYHPAIAPIVLALVRLAACLYPQYGYVHPDEFFQSTDIVAGRYFGIKHDTAWEFTTSKPIRSMFLPFTISYATLKIVRYFTNNSPSAYVLLVAPRLSYTLLSFIVDGCIYKMCKYYSRRGLWYLPLSVILQTSFAALGLLTRTLSNTLETIIFSLLLALVCRTFRNNPNFSNYTVFSNSAERIRPFDQAQTRTDIIDSRTTRVVDSNINQSITNTSGFELICLGFLMALGTFTRPTFPVFACVPLLYWLYNMWYIQCIRNLKKLFFTKLFPLGIAGLISSLFLSIFDTTYYSQTDFTNLQLKDLNFENLLSNFNLILTPLNFIKFNTNTQNLSQFGINMPLTHLLINIPLLFNILAYVFYVKLFTLLSFDSRPLINLNFIGQFNGRRLRSTFINMNQINSMMLLTIIISTILLSFIPHQEFRFLLPLIVPFVYLFSFKIYSNSRLLISWLITNTILVYFYGTIHQNGVMQTLFDLHKIVRNRALSSNDDSFGTDIQFNGNINDAFLNVRQFDDEKTNIIASRCYLVPSYILDIPANTTHINLYLSKATFEFVDTIRSTLNEIIFNLFQYHQQQNCYFILPSTYRAKLQIEINNMEQIWQNQGIIFTKNHLLKTYSPHFTGEDFDLSLENLINNGLGNWREAFGFDLYQLQMNNDNNNNKLL